MPPQDFEALKSAGAEAILPTGSSSGPNWQQRQVTVRSNRSAETRSAACSALFARCASLTRYILRTFCKVAAPSCFPPNVQALGRLL